MKCEIEVSRKIDELIALLEEAAGWLWDRGIHQWQPGSIASEFEEGSDEVPRLAVLARHEDVPAGGCILSTARPPVWQDFEGEAAYLSWLVVGRAYAGCGLAETVVGEAERWAASSRFSRLRLDCWSGKREPSTSLSLPRFF